MRPSVLGPSGKMPGLGRGDPPWKQFHKIKYTHLFEATHAYVTKQCRATSREACFFEPGLRGGAGNPEHRWTCPQAGRLQVLGPSRWHLLGLHCSVGGGSLHLQGIGYRERLSWLGMKAGPQPTPRCLPTLNRVTVVL